MAGIYAKCASMVVMEIGMEEMQVSSSKLKMQEFSHLFVFTVLTITNHVEYARCM
jgi:hypothetical protein